MKNMKNMKTNEKTPIESQEQKPQSKGKKIALSIINTVINILIVAVLLISVIIATLALTSKADPNGVPNLFGYTFEYVQTNSMKADPPEGFEGGNFSDQDVIISRVYKTDEFPDLVVGDIITFRSTMLDDNGNPIMITHRIVEKEDLNGSPVFRTKGDANTAIDQQGEGKYLVPADIVSVFYNEKYHGTILNGFAEFFRTIRSQKGFFIFILIPMIAFFIYAILRVVISAMNYKKEKAEEEKKEAVDEAVAAALAEKEKEESNVKPEDMTPEQMEQFKQFLAQQEAQKTAQASADTPDEAPAEDDKASLD